MNFTRAAERLMIAQPPLSRQIKDLEEELGSELFIRGHHSLKLTDEGVVFRDYATRIIALADQSVNDIQEFRKGLHGTIYLAEVEGKGPHLMAGWIASFSRIYPDVQFVLWNGNSDEVVDRIRKGLSDVAVIMEPYDPEGLHCVQVYSEPWVVMFRADHPLAKIRGESVFMSDLAGYELIIPSRESRLREMRDWLGDAASSINVKARIANVVTAYELCKEGLGVAIYPAAVQDIVTDRSNVLIKTIADKRIRASYVLIYSDEHPLHTVAQRFTEHILRETGSEAGAVTRE
jgi:DNA-binding transcriptional LysR family regulator